MVPMTDVEILLAVFAAIGACIAMFLIERYIEQKKRQESAALLFAEVYSALSFEWKFLDEIVEEIFSKSDAQLQEALRRILGPTYSDELARDAAISALLKTYVQGGQAEEESVIYSIRMRAQMPHLFVNLPLKRIIQCETYLVLLQEGQSDQALVPVTTHPNGVIITKQVDIEDAGEILMRYKKLPNGNIRKEDPPHEAIPQFGKLSPA